MGHVAVVLGRSSAVFTAAGRSMEMPHGIPQAGLRLLEARVWGNVARSAAALLADTCSVVTTSPPPGLPSVRAGASGTPVTGLFCARRSAYGLKRAASSTPVGARCPRRSSAVRLRRDLDQHRVPHADCDGRRDLYDCRCVARRSTEAQGASRASPRPGATRPGDSGRPTGVECEWKCRSVTACPGVLPREGFRALLRARPEVHARGLEPGSHAGHHRPDDLHDRVDIDGATVY